MGASHRVRESKSLASVKGARQSSEVSREPNDTALFPERDQWPRGLRLQHYAVSPRPEPRLACDNSVRPHRKAKRSGSIEVWEEALVCWWLTAREPGALLDHRTGEL